VYALGGISPGVVPFCMSAGAWGVAVMGPVMRARDPAATVDTLLQALA
jgi:thiamine-phosphate pyrophosphorylase